MNDIQGGDALAQAHLYASHGWPVFPCKPGRKEPATPHGFKDATTDRARITGWWTAEPSFNVASATGAPGPDVLDVDIRPDGSGDPSYRLLRKAGLLKGIIGLVATPGGGFHAYFAGTGQRSGRLPVRHLDFKAAGGYVLAPPSAVGGQPYQALPYALDPRMSEGRLDWNAAVALLDSRQRRPQPGRPSTSADVGRLSAWVAQLHEGNRNAGLFWAACRAAETGDPGDLDALSQAAEQAGLPPAEIKRTIASALRAARHRRAISAQQPGTEPEAGI
jgi:hypothetical protein